MRTRQRLPEGQGALLRVEGQQFMPADREGWRRPLPGITLAGENGPEPAIYDSRIMSTIDSMVVPDRQVATALDAVRYPQVTTTNAEPHINAWMNLPAPIVGFSGYGTGGREYVTEYDRIHDIFHFCQEAGMAIGAVSDGGTGYGVPGISGLFARSYGHLKLGFAPLRGLRGAAPRDVLTVIGNEFGDEAKALGAVPDVLVAVGGGPNTEREVRAALSVGSKVILAAFKEYPPNSVVYKSATLAEAVQYEGQLIACNNIGPILLALSELQLPDYIARRESRAERLQTLLRPC
jgi:hypothetical protein